MSTTVLPISTTSVAAAGSIESQASQPQIATLAFRAFINHITDTVRNGLSQRRPWAELADRSAFAKPESFSDATLRIRVNYLAVVALIVAVSLFTHPFSLGLLAACLFLYHCRPSDQPLVIFGRTFSDTQTLKGLVGLSVFIVFLTSVGQGIEEISYCVCREQGCESPRMKEAIDHQNSFLVLQPETMEKLQRQHNQH
ncbi:PRA1 family protein B4 isoform X2 [Rosa chinensis]|uniref:PRA1 family protein B4 isoform X2 n=1 Tax=Rosa chinensis TaxID=74649 RepID=UPI001AD8B497|nr:PRA1 family protein B4 isoform X2 [Rosa chinensis]